MKNILLGLALLFSVPCFAGLVSGGAGSVPSITLAGPPSRSDTNLNTIVLICNTSATSQLCGLRKWDVTTTAGYKPTTGKSFYVTGFYAWANSALSINGGACGYGTTDIGLNSTAAPVGSTYLGGNASYAFNIPGNTGASFSLGLPNGLKMIPDGDFGFCNSENGGASENMTELVFGYEQ